MQNTQVKKRSVGQFLLNYALYIILLAILVAVSIANPDFLQVNNIMQILKQASTRGILALGCAGLIVLAGTDCPSAVSWACPPRFAPRWCSRSLTPPATICR